MLTASPVSQVDPHHLDGVGALTGDVLPGAGVRAQGEDPQHPFVVVDPARQAGRDQAGRGVPGGGRRARRAGSTASSQRQDAPSDDGAGVRTPPGRRAAVRALIDAAVLTVDVEAEDPPALATGREQQPAPQPRPSTGPRRVRLGRATRSRFRRPIPCPPGGGVTPAQVEPGRGAAGRPCGARTFTGASALTTSIARRSRSPGRDRGRRGRAPRPWRGRAGRPVGEAGEQPSGGSGSRKAALT